MPRSGQVLPRSLSPKRTHVDYLKILHHDHRVVFADFVGGLVQVILALVGDMDVQTVDLALEFLPVVTELLLGCELPL